MSVARVVLGLVLSGSLVGFSIASAQTVSFLSPVNYPATHGTNSIAVADLNGDGKQDIVLEGPSPTGSPTQRQ